MSGISPSTSVDGLISGLNTSDIISKLMQVEAQPQNALKSQLATLKRTAKGFSKDNLTDWAAALTYYGIQALFPAILDLMKSRGLREVVVFGGGIIPEEDVAKLATLGVRGIFRPGATTEEIVTWVRENVRVRTE